MRFNISSIFPEPGYTFDVSFKVRKLIVLKINESIFNSISFDSPYHDYVLNAVIATDSKTEVISVKGPDIFKKRKMIDYAIWIPYKKTIEGEDYLKTYIDFVFIGIEEILNRCKINFNLLGEIKRTIESEVLNNSEYRNIG